ncbi:MAG: TonB family protein [Bacteroidia bacterium]|nr:TonB family protein [Bacteroidia bacterium]
MATATFNWDDRLFARRNRAYGAYFLRTRYVKHTTRALIIAVSAVGLAIAVPFIKAYIEAKLEGLNRSKKKTVITELMEPPPIDKKNEPPPPPPEQPPPPPQRAQIKFVPPQVVKEEEAKKEETIANIDTLMKVDPGTKDVEGDPNAIPDIGEGDGAGNQPVEVAEEKDPDPTAFVAVEKEPQPTNIDDIKRRIGYPPLAKEAGIQGKVIVRVLVGKNGKYEKHLVLKSPHKILTEAVEKELPNLEFTPGIQAGKPIKVWVTIPFDFQLR